MLDSNLPAYQLAVDQRQMAFEPVSKLTTSLFNALKSLDAIASDGFGLRKISIFVEK